MITRKQYMSGEATHQEYYAQFVNIPILNLVQSTFGVHQLLHCYPLDRHLNNIPLKKWDALEQACKRLVNIDRLNAADERDGKEEGKPHYKTFLWSSSTSVCILKEAARQIVEANKEKS